MVDHIYTISKDGNVTKQGLVHDHIFDANKV